METAALRSYSPIHTALGSLYASRAPRIIQLDDVWEHRACLYSLSTEMALCTPLTAPAVFRFRPHSLSLFLSLSLPLSSLYLSLLLSTLCSVIVWAETYVVRWNSWPDSPVNSLEANIEPSEAVEVRFGVHGCGYSRIRLAFCCNFDGFR